jgi:hypothetical protein
MPSRVLSLIAILLVSGLAVAQPAPDMIHLVIRIEADGTTTMSGMTQLAEPRSAVPHERYAWNLTLSSPTYIEIRQAPGAFDVERPQQVVPLLDDPANPFPLFHPFARAEVWETDGPARVYHYSMDGAASVLRLQVPGPKEAVLRLERDVTAPEYVLEAVTNVTRHAFSIETRTSEFAIGDMQRRPADGSGGWVENPTPAFDRWQRFHVQGLAAGTMYVVQPVFTDWAGNRALAPTFEVTTLPPSAGPGPAFTIISPPADGRLERGSTTPIQVRVTATGDDLDETSLRFFLDLTEIHTGWTFAEGLLHYAPSDAYREGSHVATVEATTLDGARGHVRWTFHVGPVTAADGTPWSLLVIALAAVAFLVRRNSGGA